MKKIIFLFFGILIVGIGGYYMYQQQGRLITDSDITEKSTAPDIDALAAVFQERIVTTAIDRIGFPIEGFDATLLLHAYPELQERDFEGVESREGYYSIANGTVEFVRNEESPITSAERAISNEGYRTLLINLSERTEIELQDTVSIDVIIGILAGNTGSSVAIEQEYDGKVVYTTQSNADTEPFRADCQERGGVFNECGTACAPDADICIAVCAYTCTY